MAPGTRMTLEEMEAAFPDEWVLVVDLEPPGSPDFVSGCVIGHGTDVDVLEEQARASDGPHALVPMWGPISAAQRPAFAL
ncbi:MAG: hypothetical protein ACKVT1_17630 [Dehalococcoidia bacterium]